MAKVLASAGSNKVVFCLSPLRLKEIKERCLRQIFSVCSENSVCNICSVCSVCSM